MLLQHNSKDETKKLIIAETKDDMDVLQFLYDSHIVFGLWKVYTVKGDKHKSSQEAKFLMHNFPLAAGLGFVNVRNGYVPEET